MVQYCTVQDVIDFVGEENIPTWMTDSILVSWIIQASAFIDKATDTSWAVCDISLWSEVASTPDDCEMIREATYLLISAKIVKRGGIDRLYNTGIAGSGALKKYTLGALTVEKDIGSKSTTNSESTVNIYTIILEEADRILSLFGASVDDDTIWAGGTTQDAENGFDTLVSRIAAMESIFIMAGDYPGNC